MLEGKDENHRSDILQLDFTDGNILYIRTGSNAVNVAEDVNSNSLSTLSLNVKFLTFR